jgi:cytidyltransferase-like protein
MELLNFKQYIAEEKAPQKHHVLAFGRMNPPTTGHMAVVNKVKEVADKNNAEHTVVTSHSQDKKKNPLTGAQKLKHLKRFAPGTNFKVSSPEHPTILHHLSNLHAKGVTHAHVVVGSDRVKEMKALVNKYNGKTGKHGGYNFKKITVHSAGQRDADAEGTSGVSATKQREHAKSGNFAEFRKGVPEHVSDKHAKELMHDVQNGSK